MEGSTVHIQYLIMIIFSCYLLLLEDFSFFKWCSSGKTDFFFFFLDVVSTCPQPDTAAGGSLTVMEVSLLRKRIRFKTLKKINEKIHVSCRLLNVAAAVLRQTVGLVS